MNEYLFWLGDQSATVVAELETYEQRLSELVPVRVDLDDPQADE